MKPDGSERGEVEEVENQDISTMAAGETTPSREPLSAGTVLAERYRLVRPVGRGGMGSVWEGEHLALNTPVAIKLINPALLDDEEARGRFLREARSAAALRNPHVVQIFDYGVHEDTPYIAMELLAGESLSARLGREQRTTPTKTLEILTHVSRAIAKAHEADVVHRDLKPDNIFLVEGDDGERAKVLDFGIAKVLSGSKLDASTKTGATMGTPFYMSPEQLMDAGLVDTRSDLWSLAVIAYECLLGKRPFTGDGVPNLAVSLCVDPPPVPSEHGVVPPSFDAWFDRATKRDPDERFQTAREMIEALRPVLAGDAPVLEPLVIEGVAPAWRSRALIIALGLAIAAGAGFLALGMLRDRGESPTLRTPPPRERAVTPVSSPAPPDPVEQVPPADEKPPRVDEIEEPDQVELPDKSKTKIKRKTKRTRKDTKASKKGFDVKELEF